MDSDCPANKFSLRAKSTPVMFVIATVAGKTTAISSPLLDKIGFKIMATENMKS
jgi:hypothetical protein